MPSIADIQLIGFDADDTLWLNSVYFIRAEKALAEILSPYIDADSLHRELTAIEAKNMPWYGYGVMAYTLSLMECALKVSQHRLPGKDMEWLRRELLRRRATHWKAEDLLTGILHNRLGKVLVQAVGISGYVPIAQLEEYEIETLVKAVKGFDVTLTEPMGMDSAQVTAGGIVTAEFSPETMESRLVPGLYACGEVLDIDGDCGGYNLQWAWSSGRLAGSHAGGI